MTNIVIAKKHWLVGLNWEFIADCNDINRRNVAKSLAKSDKNIKYTHFFFHDNNACQIALTKLDDRSKEKQYSSLAVALLSQLPNSFLGFFKLPKGSWVLAISENHILKNGDYFGNQREANIVFTNFKEYDFESVMEINDISESVSFLEEHLNNIETHKLIQLNAIDFIIPKNTVKRIINLVLIITTLAISKMLYSVYEDKVIARKKSEELENNKLNLIKQAPWTLEPFMSDLVNKCKLSFESIPVFYRGWNVTKWSCYKNYSQVDWSRGTHGSYVELPEGSLINLESPNQTSKRIPHEIDRRLVRRLNGKVASASKFLEISRNHQIKNVSFTEAVNTNTEYMQNEPPWMHFDWKINYKGVFPWRYLNDISDIHGVVLDNVSWSKNNNIWDANGELYVQR